MNIKIDNISLLHGNLKLPAFFPDGTYGVVKSVDSVDLENSQVDGIVFNAFHLMNKIGSATLKTFGGVSRYINWQRPYLTDSGGFQVFSLIRENEKYGQVRKNEIIFRPDMGEKKIIFSPEKCIQFQFACGSDIIMCLDYCTHPDDPEEVQKISVDTTVRWAELCREEYEKQLKNYGYSKDKRPLLFAIIQGGGDKSLRKICADHLKGMGFDGFGFGGWPLDSGGNLIEDILSYTADLMEDGKIKYAMGLGKPDEIVKCHKMGYNLFDCVIPTREARHQRLYVYNEETSENFYSFLYIMDDKYIKDKEPVSRLCDCHCCRNFSRSYLRHLFKTGDTLSFRLATIHNLRFFTSLMEKLRKGKL